MPRYFFDVEAGGRRTRDETGIDLPDARAIWPEIARLVHDCGHAAPLTAEGRVFDVTVRDEAGAVVERCTAHPPARVHPG